MTNPTSPPPAALERAREWLSHEFGSGTHDDDERAESLAALLTEERTKALEEAAAIAEAQSDLDLSHAIALMEAVPADMEVPDAIIAFYTAVGTAANALWQARCSALKEALDQAIADRDEARTVGMAHAQKVKQLEADADKVVTLVTKVEAMLREITA